MKHASIYLTAILLLTLTVSGCGKKSGPDSSSKDSSSSSLSSDFSCTPPAGWTESELPGVPMKMFTGPETDGSEPMFNIVAQNTSHSLAEYVDARRTSHSLVFKSESLSPVEKFSAASIRGLVWYASESDEFKYEYLFEKGQMKYTASFSCNESNKEILQNAVLATLKTFKF